MGATGTTDPAEQGVAALRAHAAELRRAGIRDVGLFGSVARGEAVAGSDIDFAVDFDPAARMDLFRLAALERGVGEILGRRVDLMPEPVGKPGRSANIDRDRRLAFQARSGRQPDRCPLEHRPGPPARSRGGCAQGAGATASRRLRAEG
jgi:uncharacterized protein